jgi:hypothetical protein
LTQIAATPVCLVCPVPASARAAAGSASTRQDCGYIHTPTQPPLHRTRAPLPLLWPSITVCGFPAASLCPPLFGVRNGRVPLACSMVSPPHHPIKFEGVRGNVTLASLSGANKVTTSSIDPESHGSQDAS